MPCPIALPFRRKNSTYRLCGLAIVWHAITASHKRILMAFKPNYGRDRAERQRAARARSEEKQRKKEEKAAQRKAERAGSEPVPNDNTEQESS
jgi:hypothetical protein